MSKFEKKLIKVKMFNPLCQNVLLFVAIPQQGGGKGLSCCENCHF